jgi:hypothetical protein
MVLLARYPPIPGPRSEAEEQDTLGHDEGDGNRSAVRSAAILPLAIRQRLSPGLCNAHPGALDRTAGSKRAFGLGRRPPDDYDAVEKFEREAVRHQESLGAAVIARGKQLKQPALIGVHRSFFWDSRKSSIEVSPQAGPVR